MTTRVQLGKLPNGDYGLRIVSSDGSTVIIDGTSNMFKISATGTISGTKSTGSDGSVGSLILYGSGTFTSIPAHTSFISLVNDNVTNPRVIGPGTNRTALYAALSSGASPNVEFIAIQGYSRAVVELTASPSGYAQVTLQCDNHTGGDITPFCRWYVFQETGN